jgi:serine/threonine-protein kinase
MSERKKQNLMYTIVGIIGSLCILLFILSKIIVYNTYENLHYGFTIKYPDGWGVAENQMGTVVIFSTPLENALDVFAENLNVVVQNISPDMTFREYTETAVKQLQAVFPSVMTVETVEPATLSGQKAAKLIYVGKGDQADIKMMHMWTLSGTKAYILTFAATERDFDRFYPLVKKSFNSFRITDNI